jgi:hypothetical protein
LGLDLGKRAAEPESHQVAALPSENVVPMRLFAAAILLAAGVVGYQAIDWLQTGVWTDFPVSRVLPDGLVGDLSTVTDWKGLQKIIEYVLNLHLAFLILLVGWLVASFLVD